MPTYNKDKIKILKSDMYFDLFEKRGIKYVKFRTTKTFGDLSGIRLDLSEENYIWGATDNLRKLAIRFYNDGDLWWVIGLINNKPTDGHWKIGDEVLVPLNPYIIAGVL